MTVAVLFGWRAARHPDNDYLRGWESALWPLLAYLADEGGRDLRGRLRATPASRRPGNARRPAGASVRAGAVAAHVRPSDPSRPRRGRVAVRRRRAAIPGLLQQRAGGRACPPAGDRRDRSAVTPVEHEHALPARGRDRAGGATRGEHAAPSSGLDTVLLVNSGSEANDTAWRLATGWTGGRGGLVTALRLPRRDRGDRGASPRRSGSAGERPSHVETFDPLDPYRDATAPGEAVGELTRAAERLQQGGVVPAAVLVDGGFTSDGIIAPDAGIRQGARGADARPRRAVRRRRGAGRSRALGGAPVVLRRDGRRRRTS